MPVPPLAILGAAQIASSLFSGFSGSKSAKKAAAQAKRIAKAQGAEYERQIGEEEVFRAEQRKSELDTSIRRLSTAKGIYAKSGLLLTGSPAQALEEQERIDQYNIGQMDKQSQSRIEALRAQARIAMLGGQQTASALRTQGQTAMISGLFGAAQGGINIYEGLSELKKG